MVNTSGLALDQAPPILVPLGFFLTAPAYLAAAALLLLSSGAELMASRWTPGALAAVHLVALGFLTQVMIGSLMQMLPVLAGAPVPRVGQVSRWVYIALNLGVPAQSAGFLLGAPIVLVAGSVLVAAALLPFLAAAGMALSRAKGETATVVGIGLAASALLVAAGLGLWLVLGLSGILVSEQLAALTDAHLTWGLVGWVGILVTGVSFQVLPMFYLTPEYPPQLRRWLGPAVFGLLILSSAQTIIGAGSGWALALAAAGLLVYLGVTLQVLRQRKRLRSDVTLDFWRVGLAAALGAVVAWAAGAPAQLTGVLLLMGVGVSIAVGMLYKIVPFLAWFHLQQRQLRSGRMTVRVPHTGLLMPSRWMRRQWIFQTAALAALVVAPVGGDPVVRLGGLLLLAAALLLGWNLGRAMWTYVRVESELGSGPASGASA